MEKHGAGINGLFLDFLKNVLNMVAICAHGPKGEPLPYVCCFFFFPICSHCVQSTIMWISNWENYINNYMFFCLSTYNNDWFSNEIQSSTNHL